jgi:NitT/TauT family transport system substrate-binding protein
MRRYAPRNDGFREEGKMRFLISILASLVLMTFAALPAQAADKVVLMLNWYVYGEHAPFYYGKAKGLYAAEGIDLEIQEGRGSAATTQAVAAKTANFGYVDVPTMMRAAVKGAPVVATGVLLQTSPMSVMGLAEKNIRKPEDIKGKTVAITPADSMTQIWPLFLKKTGLKESDFTTVAGDAQTKLNAVINGQADLLLGYVMDQSMKIKDAIGKEVYPIKFADYGINMVSSGIVANTDYVKANPDLVKRFMAATTKAVEAAEKDPKGAAQSILDANPKGGKIDTLTQGFELTIPLYRTPETKTRRPFQVTDQNMTDTVNLMVEYGGLDAKAKDNPKAFYTNDYLPK